MQRRTRTIRRPRVYLARCWFCDNNQEPDYKEITPLTKFMTDRGKIINRGKSGLCSKHQRRFTTAIKRARHIAYLPFIIKA